MSENALDSIYVVDRERKLLGILEADSLDEAAKAGKDSIQELLVTDFPRIGPDEPLATLYPMFQGKSIPVAVIDDQQRLLGVVVKGAVLEQLAQTGEE